MQEKPYIVLSQTPSDQASSSNSISVGTATDITVEYTLEGLDDNNIRTDRIELLRPNKNYNLDINGLPPIPNDHYSQHEVILKLKSRYRDVLGKEYHYNSDLDVSVLARKFRSQ